MSQDRRRAVDSCSHHFHRTAVDKARLDLLPLQRQPEDVWTTLGVSIYCERIQQMLNEHKSRSG